MQRPFEHRLKIMLAILEKSQKNFIYIFEKIDSILAWVVGFSITGISLIISKISDFNKNYCTCIVKATLLLLIASIVFGIIYRISALLYISRNNSILFFFEGAFSTDEVMPDEMRKIKNVKDIHEIHQAIKLDFGFEYMDVLELFKNAQTIESKDYYTNYLLEEYKRLVEWAKAEHKLTDEYIRKTFKTGLKLSEKQLNNLFKEKNHALYLKIWGKTSQVSISISIVSFVSALILLAVNYK